MHPARIVLVDDHPLVRERLAEIIAEEHDLVVCAQADNGPKALEVVGSTRANLAVVDLGLKHSSGLDLVKNMRAAFPRVPALVVSMYDETIWAERAIRAGARGYINKQEATKNIASAIRRVLAGELYLSSALAQRLATRATGYANAKASTGIESLADRELQVFELIGRGLNSRQIADRMRVDASTVDTYRARIKEKLKLRDACELLQHTIAWVQSIAVA
jgi:DNA-binding NarL/FixJ family response regulator